MTEQLHPLSELGLIIDKIKSMHRRLHTQSVSSGHIRDLMRSGRFEKGPRGFIQNTHAKEVYRILIDGAKLRIETKRSYEGIEKYVDIMTEGLSIDVVDALEVFKHLESVYSQLLRLHEFLSDKKDNYKEFIERFKLLSVNYKRIAVSNLDPDLRRRNLSGADKLKVVSFIYQNLSRYYAEQTGVWV